MNEREGSSFSRATVIVLAVIGAIALVAVLAMVLMHFGIMGGGMMRGMGGMMGGMR